MKFLFKTNAGKEGLGHINRVYSLFKALNNIIDFDYKFIINKKANEWLLKQGIKNQSIIISEKYNKKDIEKICSYSPDIIVVDTYKANNKYFQYLKENTKAALVIFDDNNDLYSNIEVDILINGNIFAEEINYKKNINFNRGLFGPQYLVMHPDFWNDKIKQNIENGEGILVTCGGADPKNIMLDLIEKLKKISLLKKIVIGPYFSNKQVNQIENEIYNFDNFKIINSPDGLKSKIKKSKIVLTAAGSTVYESLRLNKIPILYIMESDQIKIANSFKKRGLVSLGWYQNITEDKIMNVVNKASEEEFKNKLLSLYKDFDGMGAKKVAKQIVEFRRDILDV